MVLHFFDAALALFFGLFLFLQAYLIIRKDYPKEKFVVCVLAYVVPVLIALFIGSGFPGMCLYAYPIFVITFYGLFYDKILPVVGEESLLVYTILFWAAYLQYPNIPEFLTAFAFIPTIGVVGACFTKNRLPRILRFLFYVWFLAILVFLLVSQSFDLRFVGEFRGSASALMVVMEFFYLLWNVVINPPMLSLNLSHIDATGVLYLIPYEMSYLFLSIYSFSLLALLPKKGEPYDQDIKEHVALFSRKFSAKQASAFGSILIILFVGGCLLANVSLHIVEQSFLISLFVVGYGIMSQPKIRSSPLKHI